MRRTKTQITVWPAIADLMTVTAIIAITLAVAGGCGDNGSSDESGDIDALEAGHEEELQQRQNRHDAEMQEQRDSLAVLQAEIDKMEADIRDKDSKIDSLETASGKGNVGLSCFGLDEDDDPRSVATIRMVPNGVYQIFHAWNNDDRAGHPEAAGFLDGANLDRLTANALGDFHNALQRDYDKRDRRGCAWFVRLDGGALEAGAVRNTWYEDRLDLYFSLVNPGILR